VGVRDAVRSKERAAVIVHHLGPDAVSRMAPVDLSHATEEPASPIGYFDFHDCVCGIGSFIGEPPWELHTAGDELLHVLAGECELAVIEAGAEHTRRLRAGDLVVVPRGRWHRNQARDGVTMLFLTPREGNQHSRDLPVGDQA
jgi:mannose-6-phosphate isomerase-like protein (cupin superfamily)